MSTINASNLKGTNRINYVGRGLNLQNTLVTHVKKSKDPGYVTIQYLASDGHIKAQDLKWDEQVELVDPTPWLEMEKK
jgi:hypothetical protein